MKKKKKSNAKSGKATVVKGIVKGKVIGFDLDGTLIDSVSMKWQAFVKILESMGIDFPVDKQISLQGFSLDTVIRKLGHVPNDDMIIKIHDYIGSYIKKNIGSIHPFPDTISVLTELSKHNKLLIMSNSRFDDIVELLRVTGISVMLFDHIIGVDNVKKAKPDPDELFFAEKLEHHKVDYFVGDTHIDIITAKVAGSKGIGVVTGIVPVEFLEREKPFAVINSLSELSGVIR